MEAISKMKELYIDIEQCNKIVKILNDYFKDNLQIANIEYPDNIEQGSTQYFLYMFYSCLLDYGMRSKMYHKNLIETYKKYPNIFDPKFVLKMRETDLKNVIKNSIHPRYPNVAFKKWIELSRVLLQYEDILSYLRGIDDFTELNSFIRNIKGYGQKTGGLLIRVIWDSEICDFKNGIDRIPIDRHDIEISYLTGIINNSKITKRCIESLSDTYVNVGNKLGINPSNIDKYLWEVGNSFCNKKECTICPLNEYCKNAKSKRGQV